nr:RNA-directed DNA polymerase, eukaryota [Tanacetum cinerariifolium]
KKEFLNHFQERFDKPVERRVTIDMSYPRSISGEQRDELEHEVTIEEIKTAVWNCGTDKSSGPDGFTFDFYRQFWSTIDKDVLINVLGDIVSEVQPAFVVGRQILDGPFILNEVLHWCSKRKHKSLIFKVDFEKAYDSVRWDFLDDVLKKFGFGNKWCNWIQCCLKSSRGSILVNESPTDEFQFYKGLKQEDPLSPFLFILIMESLHLSFQRVVDVGLFKGINLNHSLCISHMFYADDAIFMGQWSDANITTLIHVLECFFHASGLKINLCNSKIMGVNVEGSYVNQSAVKLGCQVLTSPFIYLGTKVGGTMSR